MLKKFNYIIGMFCVFIIPLGLSYFYNFFSKFLFSDSLLSPLAVNFLLVIFFLNISNILKSLILVKTKFSNFLPGLMIFLLSLAIGVVSKIFFKGQTNLPNENIWITIFLSPIVEEILFQGIIGTFFVKFLNSTYLGIYIGSLIFSITHTMPTVSSLLEGSIKIPLGPLFLGLLSGFLLQRSKSLWPSIFTHSMCNSTVLIFSLLDKRLFDLFKIFYQ